MSVVEKFTLINHGETKVSSKNQVRSFFKTSYVGWVHRQCLLGIWHVKKYATDLYGAAG